MKTPDSITFDPSIENAPETLEERPLVVFKEHNHILVFDDESAEKLAEMGKK